ncbi:putative ribonuclease H-like domain-containing protein [Tanacetum coccineum]|uniref:Ribonuclease H-like domain-containing protein n=1 Tax=Tanacetum coccineum TaxID=301880 RepID=A0ABQ4WTT0_9ASTR
MRIEQYFLMTDYALWEVIVNGDSPPPKRTVDGVTQTYPPTTVEEKLAWKNELKARGTLLMALPNEHQLKFNTYKCAKTLMEAIEKSSEGLDQTYDRLQKLISQLDILGETISQEDMNLNPQLNDEDLQQIDADDLEEMDLKWQMAMLTMRARRFLNKTGRKINANGSATIRNRIGEPIRRNVIVETIETNALVAQDGLAYDWSDQTEEGPTNFALMVYTSSGSLSSSSSDSKSQLNIGAYKAGLESIDARLDVYKMNESLENKFEKAEKEREDLKVFLRNLEITKNLSKLLEIQVSDKLNTGVGFDSHVFDSQENDRYKTSKGYYVVPPPYIGNFMPPKYDLVLDDEGEYVFRSHDSGCSRYMTGTSPTSSELLKKLWWILLHLEEIPKGGRITGKGKISTGTKCVVLSPDFKLLDENHVLLRVPRKDNMYSVDLKNIVPSGGLTCLFAKATLDDNLWHRRLGHINFKTLNKLVRGNLVRGLPSKIFENNHTCVACQKGKKHKASCRKPTLSFMRPFGCLVTILNTLDHLGNGPNWLFDIDALTIYMNYKPVITGNQTNGNAGEEEKIGFEHLENEDSEVPNTEEPRVNQEQDANVNNTNNINTVSPTVNAADIENNVVDENIVYGCIDDLNMPNLEEIVYSDDDEEVGFELPYGKRAIGTKWVYKNKKDDRGIMVRNKARLVAQGYTQEEGIDYDEVFAPVARIEEIRLFLAYASFMNFIVYQMDVKCAFLYGIIEEEVYVCQPPGFEDPEFPNKFYKVEKDFYGLHQATEPGWTIFYYLLENRFRRGTIDKTLFIKKDKDDAQEILDELYEGAHFLLRVAASTPIETNKALLKDEEAADVDVHLYRSIIRSLMYLTASRPDRSYRYEHVAMNSTRHGLDTATIGKPASLG